MIVRSNYGGPSSARCDCPDEAGDVHYPKCPQSASSAGLAYPREQVSAKMIQRTFLDRLNERISQRVEAHVHWVDTGASDKRVAEILEYNPPSRSAFSAEARARFAVLAKEGPRWTRDGFDRCQGLTHEKWLRFLSLGYEQAVTTTRTLPPIMCAVTEAEVNAALAASGAK